MAFGRHTIAEGEVRVGADITPAEMGLRRLQAGFDRTMQNISRKKAEVKLTADKTELDRKIADAKLKLKQLEDIRTVNELRGDTTDIDRDIARVKAELKTLGNERTAIQFETRDLKEANRLMDLSAKKQEAMARQSERLVETSRKAAEARDRENLSILRQNHELAKLEERYFSLDKESKKLRREGMFSFGIGRSNAEERQLKTLDADLAVTKTRIEQLGGSIDSIDRDNNLRYKFVEWLDKLKGLRLNLGPVSGKVTTFAALIATLGPIILSVVGATGALIGVLGQGLVGAAAVGGAALAGFGLSAAGMVAVVKPAITELQAAFKAQEAYSKAVLKYGKGSKEAQGYQEKLNQTLKGMSPNARQAVKDISAIKTEWRSLTKESRHSFFNIVAEGAKSGRALLPAFAKETNATARTLQRSLAPVLKELGGRGTKGFLHTVMGDFRDALPSIIDGLKNLAVAFGNIVKVGSGFQKNVADAFDHWTKRLADRTGMDSFQRKLTRMIHQAGDILHLFRVAGQAVILFFSQGADAGDEMVNSLSRTIERWNEWMRSTEGRNHLHDFFDQSSKDTSNLLASLSTLAASWVKLMVALQPVTSGMLAAAAAISELVTNVSKLVPMRPILYAFGAAAAGAFIVNRVKRWVTSIQEAVTWILTLGKAQDKATAATERTTVATQELATAEEEAAVAGGVGPAGASRGSRYAGKLRSRAGAALGIAGTGLVAGQMIGGTAGTFASTVGTGAGLGFEVGGPWGAAAGAGIGALAGAAITFLHHGKEIPPLQRKIAESTRAVARASSAASDALRSYAGTTHRLDVEQHEHRRAVQRVKNAEEDLRDAREKYGPRSTRVFHAEVELAKARKQLRENTHDLGEAEKNNVFNQQTSRHALQLQYSALGVAIDTQKRYVNGLRKQWQEGDRSKEMTEKSQRAVKHLTDLEEEQSAVRRKGNRLFPGAVRGWEDLTHVQEVYGRHGKVLIDTWEEQRRKLHDMVEHGLEPQNVAFKKSQREIRATERQFEKLFPTQGKIKDWAHGGEEAISGLGITWAEFAQQVKQKGREAYMTTDHILNGLNAQRLPQIRWSADEPGRAQQEHGHRGPGFHATGGKVTRPTYVVGEEAPQHPEYVIATNPAYKQANVQYWLEAGHYLGVPGFARGGRVPHWHTDAGGGMGAMGNAEMDKIYSASMKLIQAAERRQKSMFGGAVDLSGISGSVASVAAQIAKRAHSPFRATLALFEALWAESSMGSAAPGNVLQANPAGGGPPIMPAPEEIAGFLTGHPSWTGTAAIPYARSHPGTPAHQIAQAVQASAFADGSNYLAQKGAALATMAKFGLAGGRREGGRLSGGLPNSALRAVAWAKHFLGTQQGSRAQRRWSKITHGPSDPWCAEFVGADMLAQGLSLPSNPAYSGSYANWSDGDVVGSSLSAAKPGDLLNFSGEHIGIYIGGGEMISGNWSDEVGQAPVSAGPAPLSDVIRPHYENKFGNARNSGARAEGRAYGQKPPPKPEMGLQGTVKKGQDPRTHARDIVSLPPGQASAVPKALQGIGLPTSVLRELHRVGVNKQEQFAIIESYGKAAEQTETKDDDKVFARAMIRLLNPKAKELRGKIHHLEKDLQTKELTPKQKEEKVKKLRKLRAELRTTVESINGYKAILNEKPETEEGAESATPGGNESSQEAPIGEQLASLDASRYELFNQFAPNIAPLGPSLSALGLTRTINGFRVPGGYGIPGMPAGFNSNGLVQSVPGLAGFAEQYTPGTLKKFGLGGGQTGSVTINNHFAAPPPDPHTWTQQQQFEIGALA